MDHQGLVMTLDQLLDLAWLFLRLGLLTIGGSDAVLSEMQREVVARGWMSAADFTGTYALARLAPGPGGFIAIPVGFRASGLAGAVVGLVAFVGPSLLLALALLRHWRSVRQQPWAVAVRTAVTPITVGLTGATAWILGTTVIHDWRGLAIAAGVTLLCARSLVPVATLPLIAGLAGLVLLAQ
jgi:chromate transporter